MLIGARAITGIGASASDPGTLSVLRHIFPERHARARVGGTRAAVRSVDYVRAGLVLLRVQDGLRVVPGQG